MSSPNQATTTTTPTMDQDLFQFFDSLAQPSPVGEWFTDTASHSSSPEIATPLDVHPSPFSAPKVDPIPANGFSTVIGVGGDLDMSDILNSPLFDSSATTDMIPSQVDLSSQINHDLPSVLAAFVAAVSSSSSTTTTTSMQSAAPHQTTQQSTVQQPVTTTSQKRSSDEPADEVALKRQKNTDAARRSRLKKVIKMESLEKRVQELERMNAQLLLRVAVLDSEKSHLQSKEATHEARIKTLESQLADAHKALSSRSS